VEKTSETQAEITVTGSVKLSEKDIIRMTQDGEVYAKEDAEGKRRAMAHHQLADKVMDALYDVTDNEDMADKVSQEDKEGVEAEVRRTRTWLAEHGPDTEMDEIDKETARFRDAIHVFMEKYKPAPPPPPEKYEIDVEPPGGDGDDGEEEDDDDDGAAAESEPTGASEDKDEV